MPSYDDPGELAELRVQVRVSPSQQRRWRAAALEEGTSVAELVRTSVEEHVVRRGLGLGSIYGPLPREQLLAAFRKGLTSTVPAPDVPPQIGGSL